MILVFKIRKNAKVRSENIYNYLTKIEQNTNIKFVEIAQKTIDKSCRSCYHRAIRGAEKPRGSEGISCES